MSASLHPPAYGVPGPLCWEVEDDELLAAARQLLENLRNRQPVSQEARGG